MLAKFIYWLQYFFLLEVYRKFLISNCIDYFRFIINDLYIKFLLCCELCAYKCASKFSYAFCNWLSFHFPLIDNCKKSFVEVFYDLSYLFNITSLFYVYFINCSKKNINLVSEMQWYILSFPLENLSRNF